MFQIADIPDVLECSRLLKPIVPVFELFAAPGPPDCGPVEDVEEEEQHWEDDQEGQVCHLMGKILEEYDAVTTICINSHISSR